MFGVFPLMPAYGRDYKSKDALITDWNAGKDFQTARGSYCSKRDFANQAVTFRYDLGRNSVSLRTDDKGNINA